MPSHGIRPSSLTFHILIFSEISETTRPFGTKLGRDVPWMVLFKVSVDFLSMGNSRWPPLQDINCFFFAFVGYYLENYNREKLIENDQHHNIRNKSLPLN